MRDKKNVEDLYVGLLESHLQLKEQSRSREERVSSPELLPSSRLPNSSATKPGAIGIP